MVLTSHLKIGLLFVSIPLALVGGYWVMRLLVEEVSLSGETGIHHYAVTAAIIAIGLGAPYWVLKAGAWIAHTFNRREKMLHLEDFPKDKDRLEKKR